MDFKTKLNKKFWIESFSITLVLLMIVGWGIQNFNLIQKKKVDEGNVNGLSFSPNFFYTGYQNSNDTNKAGIFPGEFQMQTTQTWDSIYDSATSKVVSARINENGGLNVQTYSPAGISINSFDSEANTGTYSYRYYPEEGYQNLKVMLIEESVRVNGAYYVWYQNTRGTFSVYLLAEDLTPVWGPREIAGGGGLSPSEDSSFPNSKKTARFFSVDDEGNFIFGYSYFETGFDTNVCLEGCDYINSNQSIRGVDFSKFNQSNGLPSLGQQNPLLISNQCFLHSFSDSVQIGNFLYLAYSNPLGQCGGTASNPERPSNITYKNSNGNNTYSSMAPGYRVLKINTETGKIEDVLELNNSFIPRGNGETYFEIEKDSVDTDIHVFYTSDLFVDDYVPGVSIQTINCQSFTGCELSYHKFDSTTMELNSHSNLNTTGMVVASETTGGRFLFGKNRSLDHKAMVVDPLDSEAYLVYGVVDVDGNQKTRYSSVNQGFMGVNYDTDLSNYFSSASIKNMNSGGAIILWKDSTESNFTTTYVSSNYSDTNQTLGNIITFGEDQDPRYEIASGKDIQEGVRILADTGNTILFNFSYDYNSSFTGNNLVNDTYLMFNFLEYGSGNCNPNAEILIRANPTDTFANTVSVLAGTNLEVKARDTDTGLDIWGSAEILQKYYTNVSQPAYNGLIQLGQNPSSITTPVAGNIRLRLSSDTYCTVETDITVNGNYTVNTVNFLGVYENQNYGDGDVIVIPTGTAVDFLDTSTYSVTDITTSNLESLGFSWNWDFGDGGAADTRNPNYTFNNVGWFHVNFEVVNSNTGSSDLTRDSFVLVYDSAWQMPEANFKGNYQSQDYFEGQQIRGLRPLTADFIDITDYGVSGTWLEALGYTWSWEFGDGNTSTEQYPTHTYQNTGIYDVTFTIFRDGRQSSKQIIEFVLVEDPLPCSVPTADDDNDGLTNALEVIHNTNCLNPDTDGDTLLDGAEVLTHTSNPLVLDTDSDCVNDGVEVANNTNPVNASSFPSGMGCVTQVPESITADFRSLVRSGFGPLSVNFENLSLGENIQSYSWNFGNGQTSTEVNPEVVFTNVGKYTISLTITKGSLTDNETKVEYIEVIDDTLNADFDADKKIGYAPLHVYFTDKSVGNVVENYSWNFGDGATSTLVNPDHTYTQAGKYTVSLSIANIRKSDIETKVEYIVVEVLPTNNRQIPEPIAPRPITPVNPPTTQTPVIIAEEMVEDVPVSSFERIVETVIPEVEEGSITSASYVATGVTLGLLFIEPIKNIYFIWLLFIWRKKYRGFIVDAKTYDYIPFATIVFKNKLTDQIIRLKADKHGKYFANLPVGEYLMKVSHKDHKTFEHTVLRTSEKSGMFAQTVKLMPIKEIKTRQIRLTLNDFITYIINSLFVLGCIYSAYVFFSVRKVPSLEFYLFVLQMLFLVGYLVSLKFNGAFKYFRYPYQIVRVFEKKSNFPISGVLVSFYSAESKELLFQDITDQYGRARVFLNDTGKYLVHLDKQGYEVEDSNSKHQKVEKLENNVVSISEKEGFVILKPIEKIKFFLRQISD